MFILTSFEKLIVLLGCTGLLIIVILITVCVVCPKCYINKKIYKKRRKEENELKCLRNSFPLNFLEKEPPPPYESTAKKLDIESTIEFNRRSVNSICSETDSVAGIPLPCLSDTEMTAYDVKETPLLDRGYVNITLQFKRIIGEDKVFPQLRIDLKEAGELQYRLYGGRCNPYFILKLYDQKGFNKKKRRKVGPIPIHQFYSTVVKKSQNPVFNESFFFPMENNGLKKCTLKLEAWDQDKLASDTILGEVTFHLKDFSSYLSQEPPKEMDLNLKLEESKVNYGQLLLGLCYLPTAERMTVAVLKANNLKQESEKCEGSAFYVQAMAIYGGKIFERRKTSSRSSSQYPVFNEMLMFDVPFSKLDHVVLLIVVYSTIPSSPGNQVDGQQSKDTCLGKVVIGSSSCRKNAFNHWNAMRNSPRRQVMQWHQLR